MAYTNIIPDGLPELYDTEWKLAKQQLTSRLEGAISTFPLNGKSYRFQKLNRFEATPITTRFGDTNPDEVPTEYRTVFASFFKAPKILDRREDLQLGRISSAIAPIIKLQQAAAARSLVSTIINGAIGNAYEGPNGNSPVALPGTQEVAVNYTGSTPANTGLTYAKLLEVKRRFLRDNVGGQDVEGNANITGLIGSKQWADLMNDDKFINFDYSTIKRSDTGLVKRFQDINLVVVEDSLLPYNVGTDIRTCIFFDKESLPVGIAEQGFNRVEMLPTKNYDIQLYAEWGWGANRIYDEGVITVLCDESPTN